MKMNVTWYHVIYPDGSSQTHIVEDPSDTVQFRHEKSYFESEAYHVSQWCQENHFEFQTGIISVEIPVKGKS